MTALAWCNRLLAEGARFRRRMKPRVQVILTVRGTEIITGEPA